MLLTMLETKRDTNNEEEDRIGFVGETMSGTGDSSRFSKLGRSGTRGRRENWENWAS